MQKQRYFNAKRNPNPNYNPNLNSILTATPTNTNHSLVASGTGFYSASAVLAMQTAVISRDLSVCLSVVPDIFRDE